MDIKKLFANYELKTGTVMVPNWQEDPVYIKELSAGAMDQMRSVESELEMASIAIIAGVTDADGKTVFSKGDKTKLLSMAAADLVLVSSAIIELSDLGDPAKK